MRPELSIMRGRSESLPRWQQQTPRRNVVSNSHEDPEHRETWNAEGPHFSWMERRSRFSYSEPDRKNLSEV